VFLFLSRLSAHPHQLFQAYNYKSNSHGHFVGLLLVSAHVFGIGIYRRLGFREYCTLRTYQWSPSGDEKQDSAM
jgi:hypothetical protein